MERASRGGSAYPLWFESSQQLISVFLDGCEASFCFRFHGPMMQPKVSSFAETTNKATVDQYKQILKLLESDGRTLMYTIQKIATITWDNGYKTCFMPWIVYKRLTDDELKKIRGNYDLDADN